MSEDHHHAPQGAQALFRGLAVIDAVAQGAGSLAGIGAAIGGTRSTTHRLIAARVQAGYLRPDVMACAAAISRELGWSAR